MFGAGRSDGLGEDTGHLHVAFMETLKVKTTEARHSECLFEQSGLSLGIQCGEVVGSCRKRGRKVLLETDSIGSGRTTTSFQQEKGII